MKLSLNWLSQYVGHGLNEQELARRLTMAGLEVESIEKIGNDSVFELEITPNRPDCLNMLGLAREVSAITDKDLIIPVSTEYEDTGDIGIHIADERACGRYIGTIIDNVQVKAFPLEYNRHLQAIGLKSISNIVDITNYVMFELGQPLHAFDYDKLAGGNIVVRWARKGEKIITLDDVERELDETILVIADEVKPVAIAGIMGGRDTGVGPSTKKILLEAAYFDLGVVRRGARKLGLTSDSCYRFERGVAWKNVEIGSNRATDFIMQLAGGTIVARKDLIAKHPDTKRMEIGLSVGDIQALLGTSLDLSLCEKALKRLGCIVMLGAGSLAVIPPHFRNDLKIKEDVIEELARVVGYDNLPMSLPRVQAENIAINASQFHINKQSRDLLVAQGFHEVITYSLMSRDSLNKMNYIGPVISLQNPMSAEQEIMRPTTLANLVSVAKSNINRGLRDLKLFEIGKRYLLDGEKWVLSLLATGHKDSDWRRNKKEQLDFYDLKGAIEEVFHKFRLQGLEFIAEENIGLERGQSASVIAQGKKVGVAGRIDNRIVTAFELKKANMFFAEIDLEIVGSCASPRGKYISPAEYPSMVRDISLAVSDVSYLRLYEVCKQCGGDLLQKVDFVELYIGDKIAKGLQGYVLSLTYQAKDRTLTDNEVNQLHEDIVDKLIKTCSVSRR